MNPYTPPHLRPPTGMEYPDGILPQVGKYTVHPVITTQPMQGAAGPLTYLASPYSHPVEATRALRYVKAVEATAWLIKRMQWNVFSPITHSHPLATLGNLEGTWTFWEKLDRQYIECSERLVVLELEGWRESLGVTAEIGLREQGIPIIYMAPRRGGYELQPFPLDVPAGIMEEARRGNDARAVMQLRPSASRPALTPALPVVTCMTNCWLPRQRKK